MWLPCSCSIGTLHSERRQKSLTGRPQCAPQPSLPLCLSWDLSLHICCSSSCSLSSKPLFAFLPSSDTVSSCLPGLCSASPSACYFLTSSLHDSSPPLWVFNQNVLWKEALPGLKLQPPASQPFLSPTYGIESSHTSIFCLLYLQDLEQLLLSTKWTFSKPVK